VCVVAVQVRARSSLLLPAGQEGLLCIHINDVYRVPYDKTDAASLAGSKLEQIVAFPLAGLVESMAVLRGRSSSQKDALLLTFR